QLGARKGHDCWDGLAKLTMPTLICSGLHDLMARPEASRAMAKRIPGALLRWYDGAHGFQMECPTFYDDVAAFLRGEKLPPNGLERFNEAGYPPCCVCCAGGGRCGAGLGAAESRPECRRLLGV